MSANSLLTWVNYLEKLIEYIGIDFSIGQILWSFQQLAFNFENDTKFKTSKICCNDLKYKKKKKHIMYSCLSIHTLDEREIQLINGVCLVQKRRTSKRPHHFIGSKGEHYTGWAFRESEELRPTRPEYLRKVKRIFLRKLKKVMVLANFSKKFILLGIHEGQ